MVLRFFAILLLATVINACDSNSRNSNSNSSNPNSNANSNTAPAPTFAPPEPIRPTSAADPNFKAANAYFPLAPGSTLKYTIHYASPIIANVIVVVDAGQEDGKKVFTQTWQIVDTGGGDEKNETTIRKYVMEGDNVRQVYEKTENIFRGQKSSSELKFKDGTIMPGLSSIRPGASWAQTFSQVFQLPNQPPASDDKTITVSMKVSGRESVTVPAGKFTGLKVIRSVSGNKLEISEYYVPGLGLVKREGGDGTRMELTEFSGLKPAE